MLNGIDPILLFQISKLTPTETEALSKIPLVSTIVEKIGLPPIPIYLSEKLTGLYIDTEDKNIDIETSTETLANGADPIVNQKALNSTVRINMIASKDSIGLTLLAAVADLIVPKVTSREYSITYLHGPVTVFGGLLHSFSVSQNANDTIMNVTLEISKTVDKTKKPAGPPTVQRTTEAVNLNTGVNAPPPTAPIPSTPLKGPTTPPPAAAPIPLTGLG
jgi:hypothetical protein